MPHLTPTQKRILKLLPATPDQLAQALYGRATESERNLIYVHIALLRRRLNGTAAQGAHIVSTPLASSSRNANPAGPYGLETDTHTSRIIYELQHEKPPKSHP